LILEDHSQPNQILQTNQDKVQTIQNIHKKRDKFDKKWLTYMDNLCLKSPLRVGFSSSLDKVSVFGVEELIKRDKSLVLPKSSI
jgi:hypothetical protein